MSQPGEYETDESARQDDPADAAQHGLSLQDLGRAFAQAAGIGDARLDEADQSDDSTDVEDQFSPDADDDACCPVTPQSIVEAILFVGSTSDVSLSSRKIASVLRDVSPKEVDQSIENLNSAYRELDTPFRIVFQNGQYRMALNSESESVRSRFYGQIRKARLSQAAIDVLAIVAYNQPLTRQRVDELRGRPSGALLTQLVRRKLLAVEPGAENRRNKIFRTTDRFLQLFGLSSLDELPQSQDSDSIEDA